MGRNKARVSALAWRRPSTTLRTFDQIQ